MERIFALTCLFSWFAWITWFFIFDRSVLRLSFSVVRALFFSVSSAFALVRFSLSIINTVFSSFNLLISSLTPLSASSFLWESFEFSWVSLEDFLKKEPMQREILIRGSRSSNLSSNFLKRSVRSLRSLFKNYSLLWGGGSNCSWNIRIFFCIRIFYNMNATHQNISFYLISKKIAIVIWENLKWALLSPPFAPSL